MDAEEREALLTLSLTPGWGPTLIGRCVGQFGSAAATVGGSAQALAGIRGIGAGKATRLRQALDQTRRSDAVGREHERMERRGVALIALSEAAYPKLLRHIPDPPMLLWVRGELREDDALAVAIVGARRCTHYGREQADRFAYHSAQAGLCVVSGGAHGIDGAAHRGALRAGGRTVAVLGSGLDKPYPKGHVELFEQIADPAAGRGAVISELPMAAPPLAEQFPRRNRIISGLALGVLVVEAARRSGALITARLCVEEHGREAMAVPGRVDSRASAGCHKILQEGWARLVTGAADVLDSLGEAGQLLRAGMGEAVSADGGAADGGGGACEVNPGASSGAAPPDGRFGEDGASASGSLFERNLSDGQQRILQTLDQPRSIDQIVARTRLSAGRVRSDLTMLEIRGAIRRDGGRFVRPRKQRP